MSQANHKEACGRCHRSPCACGAIGDAFVFPGGPDMASMEGLLKRPARGTVTDEQGPIVFERDGFQRKLMVQWLVTSLYEATPDDLRAAGYHKPGPDLVVMQRGEFDASVKRDLDVYNEQTAKLEAAASELAELRAKLGFVRDQRDTETSTKNDRIESLDRERRDLGDKAIRLEVQLAELRVENERLKAGRDETVSRLLPVAMRAIEAVEKDQKRRNGNSSDRYTWAEVQTAYNRLENAVVEYRAALRGERDQAQAAEPEATVVAEPCDCGIPTAHLKWCSSRRAAPAVEAQDPMTRAVTFGELVEVLREVRTGFSGPVGGFASELAKHLEAIAVIKGGSRG